MRTVCTIVMLLVTAAVAQETHRTSQCFKSRGIPRVSFSCPLHHMVHIERAFHGIALPSRRNPATCVPNPGHPAANCSFCVGDCVDDSMNLVYDWSTCIGNASCARTVMQSYIPSCPGSDKFSDYLQVHYQCIARADVIDICSRLDKRVPSGSGYIVSPDYPSHYPANQDCDCRLEAESSAARITITFFDLLLETKNGRCRADWLMLRQGERKHRHCGAIVTGSKNVTTEGSTVAIQFHTDASDNRTQNFQYFTRQLKGFWVHFSTTITSAVQLKCRRLAPTDREVTEIQEDDALFEVKPALPALPTMVTMTTPGGSTTQHNQSDSTEPDVNGNSASGKDTETAGNKVTDELHSGSSVITKLTTIHLIILNIIILTQ